MSVKKLTLRALTDRVQTEADILQILGGIKAFLFRIESLVLSFNELIKIRENGVVGRFEAAPVGIVTDIKFFL